MGHDRDPGLKGILACKGGPDTAAQRVIGWGVTSS